MRCLISALAPVGAVDRMEKCYVHNGAGPTLDRRGVLHGSTTP